MGDKAEHQQDYETLINYLNMKVRHLDWHGVSDAANDIRVFVAQHPEVEQCRR